MRINIKRKRKVWNESVIISHFSPHNILPAKHPIPKCAVNRCSDNRSFPFFSWSSSPCIRNVRARTFFPRHLARTTTLHIRGTRSLPRSSAVKVSAEDNKETLAERTSGVIPRRVKTSRVIFPLGVVRRVRRREKVNSLLHKRQTDRGEPKDSLSWIPAVRQDLRIPEASIKQDWSLSGLTGNLCPD